MRFIKLLLLFVIAAMATLSIAQGFGGMMRSPMAGNPAFLMRRDDVKNDLALTDKQRAKLADLQDTTRQSIMQAIQDAGTDKDAIQKSIETEVKKATEELNKILTADQQKRLKQISIQLSGNDAILDKDVQAQLNLTTDQKSKIDDLQSKQKAASASIMEKLQNGDLEREQLPDLFKKNDDVMKDELGKVLTDDQKKKLVSLGGKPFKPEEDENGG